MTNFVEFHCLFNAGEDSITGQIKYDMSIVCIDLNRVVAFNPFTKPGYTVLRLSDGNSYVVDSHYDDMKKRFHHLKLSVNN